MAKKKNEPLRYLVILPDSLSIGEEPVEGYSEICHVCKTKAATKPEAVTQILRRGDIEKFKIFASVLKTQFGDLERFAGVIPYIKREDRKPRKADEVEFDNIAEYACAVAEIREQKGLPGATQRESIDEARKIYDFLRRQ